MVSGDNPIARAVRPGQARSMAQLSRPQSGRFVAGVCAAIARRFNVSPTLVRVLFVVSCLLPGPQFLIYIAMWIVVPSEG
jgi:phage shock protein PspC (stress-responsive transcriptional regulator)